MRYEDYIAEAEGQEVASRARAMRDPLAGMPPARGRRAPQPGVGHGAAGDGQAHGRGRQAPVAGRRAPQPGAQASLRPGMPATVTGDGEGPVPTRPQAGAGMPATAGGEAVIGATAPRRRRGWARAVGRALAFLLVLVLAGTMAFGFLFNAIYMTYREDVSGMPADIATTIGQGLPAVSYRMLYEDGGVEAMCYEAFSSDLSAGVAPDSRNPLTWPTLPRRSEGSEEALASIMQSVVLDDPRLSAWSSGEVSLGFLGARYLMVSGAAQGGQDAQALYAALDEAVGAWCDAIGQAAGGDDSLWPLVAYRALCEGVEYVDEGSEADPAHGNDAYGALCEGQSRCLGMSCALKLLLDRKGQIPNFVAYGQSRADGAGHAWNVLWVNGSWVVCDVSAGSVSLHTLMTPGTEGRLALDSNPAAIPVLLPMCMARQGDYLASVEMDARCERLEARYEALVTSLRASAPLDGAVDAGYALSGALGGGDAPRSVDAVRGDVADLMYSSLLDDEQLRFYQAVVEDLSTGKLIDPEDPATWFISPVTIGTDEECQSLATIAECAMYDHPELSVTNGGGGWMLRYQATTGADGTISRYAIGSPISTQDGETQQKVREVLDRAQQVADGVAAEVGDDQWLRVHAAYREIATGCTYSDDVDDTIHHNDAYGALIEGESKCYGVSCAMKLVLDRLGVRSFVAFGQTEEGGHAWNVVRMDGRWWACDITAGSSLAAGEYAEGTVMRAVLEAGVDPADPFYQLCMMPVDEYYSEMTVFPDGMSTRLCEAYEGLYQE